MKRVLTVSLLAFCFVLSTPSVSPQDDEVMVRVVDVGAGLCTVTKMPGNHYMVYDTGDFPNEAAAACFNAVQEIVPDEQEIDLLVLSHSDADHLGAADEILDAYRVKRIIHTGMVRSTQTWKDANAAIDFERDNEGALDLNLSRVELPAGATYRFGEAFVTVLSGFGSPPADWETELQGQSEERNSVSIVVRLQYKGKSILYGGDAVGRHIDGPANQLIATERFIVEGAAVLPTKSDVLIAPHHGADNGNSTAFIQAVSPTFVIFSAGHKHKHPRQASAQRYLNIGVALTKMFRTDLGDDEGSTEWNHGRQQGHSDPIADDDVEIRISASGQVSVGYRTHP